ncbi:MAG: hypothetical protein AAGM84_10000 [Pseudomonadota bacterium]
MATIISTNTTSRAIVNTDDLLILSTGSIVSSSSDPLIDINSNGRSAIVLGAVVTEGDVGNAVRLRADGTSLTVGSTGVILATNDKGDGILYTTALETSVSVAGYIYAVDFGVLTGGTIADFDITQSGTIIGGSDVGDNTTFPYSAAFGAMASVTNLTNAGVIRAEENVTTGAKLAIINAAFASVSFNPLGFNETTSLVFNFTNTGSVFGDVYLAAGMDSVTNGGFIDGRVDMGADNDTYLGAGGTVTGLIALGNGDDTGIGGAGADSIAGGGGQDTIRGGGGEDEILGGNQNDDLNGGSADDVVIGGLGNDQLRGGQGNDELRGEQGNDTIHGASGDDAIFGASGNDIMTGGSGDDALFGGAGSDRMTGGSGADVFIYANVTDSRLGALRDVIFDFKQGEDVIDVTGIGVFDFIGTSGFTGTGAEIRYAVNAVGITVVSLDADGDGAVDSQIILRNLSSGVEIDDFVL